MASEEILQAAQTERQQKITSYICEGGQVNAPVARVVLPS